MTDRNYHVETRDVLISPLQLPGVLNLPSAATGLVVFAHGSGSSRFSPRNTAVASALNQCDLATLLFDLLTESEQDDRANVFNIPLLTKRLVAAIHWADTQTALQQLPLGIFGASTGAAAALAAAVQLGERVGAVVSRGGRPDLAHAALPQVTAPTLLIVGGADTDVLMLNRQAFVLLHATKSLEVVPGATHLFSEPGAMAVVIDFAARWFSRYLQ